VPHPQPRRQSADLDADLLGRARKATIASSTVETVVTIAQSSAAEMHERQIAAIVRLLQQAVELRRAA